MRYTYTYIRIHTHTHTHIFFKLFRVVSETYGSSQARGQFGAAGASLYHSHSNEGSELCLWSTLQLKVTPDP